MSNFTTWRSLVDGEEIGAIPDSVVNRYSSSALDLNDGATVDPWPDEVGSVDLPAEASPTYDETKNAVVTVREDGDGFVVNNLGASAPVTLVFALTIESFSGIATIYREGSDEELLLREDANEWFWGLDGQVETGGSYFTGDAILTVLVDGSNRTFRLNGSDVISASSGTSAGVTVLNNGGLFKDVEDNRRELPADHYEVAIHNERLSGSELTDEEERVEEEAGFNVL